MARTADGVNKSQAIRDAVKANPKAKTREISELLNSKGVEVTPAYVSMIKSGMKRKGKKPGRPRKSDGDVGGPRRKLNSLEAAVEFVRASGGLDAAKQALAAIEEIRRLS